MIFTEINWIIVSKNRENQMKIFYLKYWRISIFVGSFLLEIKKLFLSNEIISIFVGLIEDSFSHKGILRNEKYWNIYDNSFFSKYLKYLF